MVKGHQQRHHQVTTAADKPVTVWVEKSNILSREIKKVYSKNTLFQTICIKEIMFCTRLNGAHHCFLDCDK